MKKGILLVIFLFVCYLTSSSQINRSGTPMISWFDVAETPGELINLCITMDKRGVMFFGNVSSGIVTYDGTTWRLIPMPVPQSVNALISDHRGVVFAGGGSDFGLLEPDNTGRLKFSSLTGLIKDSTARSQVGSVSSVTADSNKVFFIDGRRLYLYDIEGDSLSVTDMEKEYGLKNAFTMLSIESKTFIADDREGLFWYIDGKLTRLPGGEKIRMVNFAGLLPYDRDNILVATEEQGLVLFNHRTGVLNTQFLNRDDNNRIRNGPVTAVTLLPGNMIAAGLAANGGVLIFSHEGRLLHHITDATTEIRESTVASIYCDYRSNSQLWFTTRGFINRAYISLPAREFGRASGLNSVACGLTMFDDSVFVASDDGLYKNYLDKSGTVRFRRIEKPARRVNELVSAGLPDGSVLLTASADGLWQTDTRGKTTRILGGEHLTALGSGRYDPTLLITGSDDGVLRTLKYSDEEWSTVNPGNEGQFSGTIKRIIQLRQDEWWILTSSPSTLTRMLCSNSDTMFINYGREQGLACDTLSQIAALNDRLYVCTGKGLWRYDGEKDLFEKDGDLIGKGFDNVHLTNLIKAPEGDIFIAGFDSRNFNALVTTTSQGHVIFKRQFDFLPDLATTGMAYIDGNIWIAKGQSIYIIDKSKLAFSYGAFNTYFTRIITGGNRVMMEGSFFSLSPGGARIPTAPQPEGSDISLRHSRNSITLSWTTTSYVAEDKTEYRHRLDGFDSDWSGWDKRTSRDYTNLPSGDYSFRLKSKLISGPESEEVTFAFSVRRAWYLSLVAMILYFIVAAWLIYYAAKFYIDRLRTRKRRLENIMRQRSEATDKAKTEMTDLEQYAGRIQQALMPSEKILYDAVRNSFILNKPRNSISGDFYWMVRRGDSFFAAVGDCTGQGVSSAFTTLMGLSFLDEICNRPVILRTSVIVSEFRRKQAAAHKRTGIPGEQPVKVDLAVLSINRMNGSIGFSGAGTQCYRVREMTEDEMAEWKSGGKIDDEVILANGKYILETVSGDRIPAGIQPKSDQEFTQHEWKLEKNTSYYLFTDGYADQFNGVNGKKFMKRNFRKLVLDIQNYPMSKQKEMLEERLKSWMGSAPQTDDILIVGFKIE
jgi:Y_Y_Y domain/Stage II sporulation protein E (SpoIIE)